MKSFFPFVTRSHHEEVVEMYRNRVATLEQELHRLKDLIFSGTFGVQLHDTLPNDTAVESLKASGQKEPEPQFDEQEAAELRRLASLRRTRPSQLGPAMAQMMQRRAMRMARAVFPKHTVPAAAEEHPARKLFSKAKREALA